MSLVREPGSSLIGEFNVPFKGTWRGVSANMLTSDSLYDSSNVFIRLGKLRSRPGLTLLNNTVFSSAVKGGAMAVTPTDKINLAFTANTLYTLKSTDSVWQTDTTGLAYNSDVDVSFIETSSQYVAVIANGLTPLNYWIQGSGVNPITATTGTVPVGKSVCTVARRIVTLVDPHTLRWSNTLTYTDWPDANFNKLAQTNDLGIAVVPLSNLTFATYKERSIYLGKAIAGPDVSAFALSEPIIVEGPAGVHAIVNANGTHLYMTKNGRVGLFDGSRYVRWIADGLWFFLQDDIDPVYASNIFGVFDYRLHTATFWYPRVGDAGLLKGMVIINLPLEGSGIGSLAPFLGISSLPCSFAYEQRFNGQIDRSLIFTSGVKKSYRFDENATSDDGVLFNCSFQTGLTAMPDSRGHQLTVESFLERSDGYGSIDINAVASDTLESPGGRIDTSLYSTIDLNKDPIREYKGFNIPTRFFGLKYSWVSSSTVRYAGALLYGRVIS